MPKILKSTKLAAKLLSNEAAAGSIASILCLVILLFDVLVNRMNIVNFVPMDFYTGNDPWGAALVWSNYRTLANMIRECHCIPLWDATEAAGRPILGDPSYKLFDPFSWIFIAKPSLTTAHAIVVFRLFLTGTWMWCLLRNLGCARFAALVGTLLWQANGHMTGFADHNHMDVYMFLPLAILGVRHAFSARYRRAFVSSGVSFGFFFMGGNPQSTLVALLLVSLVTLAETAHSVRSKGRILPPYAILTAAGLCGIGLAAPDLVAMFDYRAYWVNAHIGGWSPYGAGAEVFLRWFTAFTDQKAFFNVMAEGVPSFGLPGALLIVSLLPFALRRPLGPVMLLGVVVNFYLLFEDRLFPSVPVRTLIQTLPSLREFRYIKYTEAIFLASSILAALGIDGAIRSTRVNYIRKKVRGSVPAIIWIVTAFSATTFLLFCLKFSLISLVPLKPEIPLFNNADFWDKMLPITFVSFLFALSLVSTLRPRLSAVLSVLLKISFLGALWLELRQGHAFTKTIQTRSEARHRTQSLENIDSATLWLQSQNRSAETPFRILSADYSFIPAYGNNFGLEHIQGSNAVQVGWYYNFFTNLVSHGQTSLIVPGNGFGPDLLDSLKQSPWPSFLGVKYWVSGPLGTPITNSLLEKAHMEAAFVGKRMTVLHSPQRPSQRAFVVQQFERVETPDHAISKLSKSPQDFLTKAYLTTTPEVEASFHSVSQKFADMRHVHRPSELQFKSRSPNSMVLRVNSSGGFLIMADVWYPHWKAAVDNTEVPVFLAQGAFRAIPVPEGSHLVELHYKPWFLPWSIAAWFLSVCSISSLAAWRLQKWLKLLRLMKCFPKFTEPMHIEHLALAYTPAPFRGLVAKHWNFLFYSLIGASGAALDYILFVGMVSWGGTDKYIANAISVTAGISNNFVLNAFFNFNSRDKLLRRFGYFYATGIAGLLLSNLLLHIGVDRLDWNVPAVKFFSIFFVVLLQFNLNKTFAFRRSST